MPDMSEKEKAEQRKKFYANAAKAGVPQEYMKLLRMAGDSADEEAAEELPRLPGDDSPKLGLGTQGTGVTSTQGALGPVPKLGFGTKNTSAAGKNVGDGVTQTASSQFTFAPRDKDSQKFFKKPVVRKSSSKLQVGKLGDTKQVYSPRRGMRRAMRVGDVLRKRGYGDVASDVVRGSVGLAGKVPTTRSTVMKKAMEAQDREAQIIAAANAAEARRKVREQFKGA